MVTDADIEALIDNLKPLEKGWTQSGPEIIMPIDHVSVWNWFFADDAPYAPYKNM